MRRVVPFALLSLLLFGCDSEPSTTAGGKDATSQDASTTQDSGTAQDSAGQDGVSASDTVGDTATGPDGAGPGDGSTGTDTSTGDTAGPTLPPPTSPLCGKYADEKAAIDAGNVALQKDGYFLAVWAKPFGIALWFRADVVGPEAPGGKSLRLLSLRAISQATGEITAPMATLCDVPVAADGSFTAAFGNIVLPGKASPTVTDVKLTLTLKGKLTDKAGFCGTVEGFVPDFSQDLAGSTFKAVATGKQGDNPETSCEGGPAKVYKPIEQCPALVAGGKTTLTSAERAREVEIFLPESGTPTEAVPMVVLYHGVGGDPAGIVKDSKFAELLKTDKFVLVAPKSERDGAGKAVLKTDWYYGSPLFGMDNPDLVFFDDLVTCVSKQWKIDPKRIYVTGMSGGGLMSTFAALHRPATIAAAAPFSGGYLHAFPKGDDKLPFLVTWGGPEDKAYEQNFDNMAKALIANLLGTGHPTVQCEHALKHEWPAEMTAPAWGFLSAHTKGGPAPDFSGGLPKGFPAYCKVAKK